MVRHRAMIYSVLFGAFLVSLILAFTSAGFPYSGFYQIQILFPLFIKCYQNLTTGSIDEPRVQRHYLIHTQRTFYTSDGSIYFKDQGFHIKENERNSKRTLDLVLKDEILITKDEQIWCQFEAFCGYPNYNSTNALWMPATEPPKIKKSSLTRITNVKNGQNVEMSFDVRGSLLTLLYLQSGDGVEITETSKGFNEREWIAGKFAMYLKITYGKPATKPFSFTVKMNVSNSESSDLLKVTLVSLDSHFDDEPPTKEFQNLIDKFPDYVFVQHHQADVSSYAFK
jgi:hypothetical protein